jgi:hypothetical protein
VRLLLSIDRRETTAAAMETVMSWIVAACFVVMDSAFELTHLL